jgi:predicted alpha/beta-fold hydrolase
LEFDELFTAPRAGIESRDLYYELFSSKNHLQNLNKPHIILMSKDDPFVSFNDYLEATYSPKALLYFGDVGGHLGYIHNAAKASAAKTSTDKTVKTQRWLDYFLLQCFEFIDKEL